MMGPADMYPTRFFRNQHLSVFFFASHRAGATNHIVSLLHSRVSGYTPNQGQGVYTDVSPGPYPPTDKTKNNGVVYIVKSGR